MSNFAIIKLAGQQFRVVVGDKLTINRLDQKEGQEFKSSEVLMIGDEQTSQVGTPLVDKAVVTLKILEHKRSKKIRVAKFRAKSHYRRVKGHRQPQSVVEVLKIVD